MEWLRTGCICYILMKLSCSLKTKNSFAWLFAFMSACGYGSLQGAWKENQGREVCVGADFMTGAGHRGGGPCGGTPNSYRRVRACAAASPQGGAVKAAGRKTLALAVACIAGAVLLTTYSR